MLATLVSVALNAAAYHPPPCGPNGYFKNYFKVARFWGIPFCVSSISVACNASPDECKLLFPTDVTLLQIHVAVMVFIMAIGSLIQFVILPKCPCHSHSHQHKNDGHSRFVASSSALKPTSRTKDGEAASFAGVPQSDMSGDDLATDV